MTINSFIFKSPARWWRAIGLGYVIGQERLSPVYTRDAKKTPKWTQIQTQEKIQVFLSLAFGSACVHLFSLYGFDQQGWYGMFVACGIWCLADVSSVSPSSEQTGELHNSPVCSDEGLTLETSAKHHIPQATNIPYQPCWSNPYLAYSPTQKNSFFSKLVFECFLYTLASSSAFASLLRTGFKRSWPTTHPWPIALHILAGF